MTSAAEAMASSTPPLRAGSSTACRRLRDTKDKSVAGTSYF